jgi:SOS-response transcriptional repressor LexA
MDTTQAAQKIKKFYLSEKRLPTYREIMQIFNYSSTSPATYLVDKLIQAEILGKDEKGNLVPNKLFAIPLLGSIRAGYPSPAYQYQDRFVDFFTYLHSFPEDTFALEVKGDSMIDAGINEGDIAIIEKGKEPQIGDIVAALIDGEITLKLLMKEKGKFYLSPANKNYTELYPMHSLSVDGVVINIIRKYH